MKGRKPKPAALRRAQGNPGKRPIPEEPQLRRPARAPYAPRWLSEEAKAEWRRIAPLLLEAGLLTEADYTALALYCQAYARWRKAEEKLAEQGEILESARGGLYQNPWLAVANRAWDQIRKSLAEFGMTPSSRLRVAVAREPEKSLAELLFEGVAERER